MQEGPSQMTGEIRPKGRGSRSKVVKWSRWGMWGDIANREDTKQVSVRKDGGLNISSRIQRRLSAAQIARGAGGHRHPIRFKNKKLRDRPFAVTDQQDSITGPHCASVSNPTKLPHPTLLTRVQKHIRTGAAEPLYPELPIPTKQPLRRPSFARPCPAQPTAPRSHHPKTACRHSIHMTKVSCPNRAVIGP